MATVTFPSTPAELTPTASKVVTAGSYIDFQNASFNQWSQQYMPELYEAEVERYGNRSIASFLRLVGAEIPMASDNVIWTEQGRLHLAYEGVTCAADSGGANVISGTPLEGHAIRVGQTIVISDGTDEAKAYVSAVDADTITVKAYAGATGLVNDASIATTASACKLFVFGSEFGKGTAGMSESITPDVHTFSNKPIILKDKFSVSGSDAAQIGWIEVTGEAGQTGYLWYMKAEGDTRTRFEDSLEMACIEAEKATEAAAANIGLSGTEGLFAAISNRGLIADGAFDTADAEVITDFELILKELDKQGGIEENMLFLNRTASLAIDAGLAAQNSYGVGGTSYGVFENSEDMALNLGFSGFRKGTYDFYKTDWKYLNNIATRGLMDNIEGVLVPAGTTTVYDQMMGKNVRRPFLHVRYRANESENRKLKSWITGSVGGASNSDVDEMNIHYLSERCLVTQAANNFVLFQK